LSEPETDFWREISLSEMSAEQWESVCDGCGKCCLQQLEDESSGQLVFTDVVCDLLNTETCRCTDYKNRSIRVPDCMTLTPENVTACAEFAPPSCAYRLLVQGEVLPEWHHLRSGSKKMMHELDKSVIGKVVKESAVNERDLEDHVVDWPASLA
jgi:uncharacterized cysteine cluster protein YcgN (CxxCxxCC family)